MCGCGQGELGQLQGAASEDFMLEVVEIEQGEDQRVSDEEEGSGASTCSRGRPARSSQLGLHDPFTCCVCYSSSHC